MFKEFRTIRVHQYHIQTDGLTIAQPRSTKHRAVKKMNRM